METLRPKQKNSKLIGLNRSHNIQSLVYSLIYFEFSITLYISILYTSHPSGHKINVNSNKYLLFQTSKLDYIMQFLFLFCFFVTLLATCQPITLQMH